MNSTTSTKLCDKIGGQTKSNAETQLLAVIALACYSTALTALIVLGYSLLSFALSAAEQQIAVIYSPLGI